MKIKKINANIIFDSRGDKTIKISINTNIGNFFASAPNGKSKGKNEAKPYKKSLEEDIKTIKNFSEYFSDEIIEKFDDLHRVEDIIDGHLGANTFFALEAAILKALSKEQKKEIWELICPEQKKLKKFPRLVGNCIGGGMHSDKNLKRPDFQEFLIIPDLKSVKESFIKNKELKNKIKNILEEIDKNFKREKNSENAWIVSLNEKEILDILKKLKSSIGLDIAASSFYKRKKYFYKNPKLERNSEEQFSYLINLIKNYNLFYIEDPFYEEDFESYSELLKKFPKSLIVGDDLIVTNYKRLKKAIEKKSVNAIIVKPNQCGSLIEVKRVCELARNNDIKIVFSHRSGETKENILADLAFGFKADFFKCGIDGKEREAKLRRLIEIERSFM
jgi:enolase